MTTPLNHGRRLLDVGRPSTADLAKPVQRAFEPVAGPYSITRLDCPVALELPVDLRIKTKEGLTLAHIPLTMEAYEAAGEQFADTIQLLLAAPTMYRAMAHVYATWLCGTAGAGELNMLGEALAQAQGRPYHAINPVPAAGPAAARRVTFFRGRLTGGAFVEVTDQAMMDALAKCYDDGLYEYRVLFDAPPGARADTEALAKATERVLALEAENDRLKRELAFYKNGGAA